MNVSFNLEAKWSEGLRVSLSFGIPPWFLAMLV